MSQCANSEDGIKIQMQVVVVVTSSMDGRFTAPVVVWLGSTYHRPQG